MKVHILNYGCSANQASAEIMAAKINEYGHELVDDESSAQAVVINTCTVKSTTEKRSFTESVRLERLKENWL